MSYNNIYSIIRNDFIYFVNTPEFIRTIEQNKQLANNLVFEWCNKYANNISEYDIDVIYNEYGQDNIMEKLLDITNSYGYIKNEEDDIEKTREYKKNHENIQVKYVDEKHIIMYIIENDIIKKNIKKILPDYKH